MASNPRIDDLRKRLEKDPGSRLFAQLAEELRKAGELEEAIAVSREGLQKHPAYPSARMTLGRALFDKGALAEARGELEGVLKGAADNILASRLLAECLEGLRDAAGALERYRLTLAMAPGDRQIASKVSALEAKVESASRTAAAPEAGPAPPPSLPAAPYAPIPLVAADEPFELERPYEGGATRVVAPQSEIAFAPPPIGVPALEPEVEPEPAPEPGLPVPPVVEPAPVLEAAPAPANQPVREPAPSLFAAPASAPPETPPSGELFEFDAPDDISDAATLKAPAPTFEEAPAPAPPPLEAEPPVPPILPPEDPRLLPETEAEPLPPWVAPAMAGAPPPEIISSTLAELYFNQGFSEKAIEVYQQVLGREPGNDRARVRLVELQGLEKAPQTQVAAGPAAGDGEGRAARRQAIERVIASLEGLRATLRRG